MQEHRLDFKSNKVCVQRSFVICTYIDLVDISVNIYLYKNDDLY